MTGRQSYISNKQCSKPITPTDSRLTKLVVIAGNT